jgi:hypothetical protein
LNNTNLIGHLKSLNPAIKMLMLLALLASCVAVDAPKSSKRTLNEIGGTGTDGRPTNEDQEETPTFTDELNVIQDGLTKVSGTLQTSVNNSSTLFLKGKQIDSYIKNVSPQGIKCLSVRFPSSVDHKVLLMAAIPMSIPNLTTRITERVYRLEPSNADSNFNFCNDANLLATLTGGGDTIANTFKTLCPNCLTSTLNSDRVFLRESTGAEVPTINLSYIRFRLINELGGSNNNSGGNSCQVDSDCEALNSAFDCCSSGQCIVDKSVKSTVDQTSAAFKTIDALRAQDPDNFNFNNHRDIYNLCPVEVVDDDPEPTPDLTPEEVARLKIEHRRDLYECTQKIEGEMSICTVSEDKIKDKIDPTNGYTIVTDSDDLNFQTVYSGSSKGNIPTHSIYSVTYAGLTLFDLKKGIHHASLEIGPGNDNLSDTNSVKIKPDFVHPSKPANDKIVVKYKIDGSCERVNTSLAKCQKTYIQGQNLNRIDDHYPGSNTFILPNYADTNRSIKVTVNDESRAKGNHFNVQTATSPRTVDFVGTGIQVRDTERVDIYFYVDLNSNPILKKQLEAKNEIAQMCGCVAGKCGLKPKTETLAGNEVVVDYICTHDQPDNPPIPLQTSVNVQSQTAPHRFFDTSGVYQKSPTSDNDPQEGTVFEYEKNNPLKPNNVNNYIGFNEIYGSFVLPLIKGQPAKEVAIENKKTYDIYVDEGSFSSCKNCGRDYYSASISRLFPSHFHTSFGGGGGYFPDGTSTNRTTAKTFRSDDLLFGRACFLPATMIPWSHRNNSGVAQQRRERLNAQHFLFANGYQRDWYGFDYGSIIGSFDGVHWFSVGNKRRIKATSNKLFLAVNAYFTDLTDNQVFKVRILDSSINSHETDPIDSDFESSGAQCQQYHQCEVDSDCTRQLGYEYMCESVSSIKSQWPNFDQHGNELPNANSLKSLATLVKTQGTGTKRCVYRGKGAPCTPNYTNVVASNSYAQTDKPRINSCAPNFYCQEYKNGGADVAKFNDRIARFARSVVTQNNSTDVAENDLDTFGLGTRLIGRPMNYQGTSTVPTEVQNNLNDNKVTAICLPGRDPSPTAGLDFATQHATEPTVDHNGDKVLNMGMVPLGETITTNEYLSSCGVFDEDGDYFQMEADNLTKSLDDAELVGLAGGQAISTTSLSLLESLSKINITKNFDNLHITSRSLEENRCLRAPGSACHTDLDCAPSQYIADRTRGLNAEDTSLHATLNKYEILFWQEELICHQDKPKTITSGGVQIPNPEYKLKNNRCCRDLGKTVTIGTELDDGVAGANIFNHTGIAGIDMALNDPKRYSRNATVYTEVKSGTLPAMEGSSPDRCGAACKAVSDLNNQWKTFSQMAQRTCCSGHYVRSFASGTRGNGGGHKWEPAKMQNIPLSTFRCLNWSPGPNNFSCGNFESPNDPGCDARATSNSEAAPILEWLQRLQLTGIPNIAIQSDTFEELACKVSPTNQANPAGANEILHDIITLDQYEYTDGGTERFFSADDMDNFDTGIKQVFSNDEVTCCIPAGQEVAEGTNESNCCTGFINPQTNRCALQDFSNVSVYFNRFVSSAAKELSDSLFDQETGFIKSTDLVRQLACEENVCASGTLALGIVHSNLPIEGHATSTVKIKRFLDGKSDANNRQGLADLFEQGLQWNNAVYCVPADIDAEAEQLNVTVCNQ